MLLLLLLLKILICRARRRRSCLPAPRWNWALAPWRRETTWESTASFWSLSTTTAVVLSRSPCICAPRMSKTGTSGWEASMRCSKKGWEELMMAPKRIKTNCWQPTRTRRKAPSFYLRHRHPWMKYLWPQHRWGGSSISIMKMTTTERASSIATATVLLTRAATRPSPPRPPPWPSPVQLCTARCRSSIINISCLFSTPNIKPLVQR